MKLLIFGLLFYSLPNVYWVEELKGRVSKIDSDAELTKKRSVIDRWGEYGIITKQFEYELKKTKKTVKIAENLPTRLKTGYKQQFYHHRNFIFYTDYHCVEREVMSRCKICSSFDHNGDIVETKKFFKNDSLGLQYSRSIPYCVNQNLDSMRNELGKAAFEVKPLNSDDYREVLSKLKSARHGISRPDRIIER